MRGRRAKTAMTQTAHNAEYMGNVKWITMLLYVLPAVASILIAIIGCYYGLKGDIKDSRTEFREQITAVATGINKKIDSVQHKNDLHFQKIDTKLEPIFNPTGEQGKLIFVPAK